MKICAVARSLADLHEHGHRVVAIVSAMDVPQPGGQAVWGAISTAIGWMKRVDETGSSQARPVSKPKAISGEHAV
ncbi:transposase [Bradyrhizobium ottawaense]|uniref:hypothetical protein n=1 Tax=Bradyrhizobium ottawaense TaxID=931866 RepID=UPI003518F5E5